MDAKTSCSRLPHTSFSRPNHFNSSPPSQRPRIPFLSFISNSALVSPQSSARKHLPAPAFRMEADGKMIALSEVNDLLLQLVKDPHSSLSSFECVHIDAAFKDRESVDIIKINTKDLRKNPILFKAGLNLAANSNAIISFSASSLERALQCDYLVKKIKEELQPDKDCCHKPGSLHPKIRSQVANFDDLIGVSVEDSVYLLESTVLDCSFGEALDLRKGELDAQLKSLKSRRTISQVVFGGLSASVLACSAVAGAVAIPLLALGSVVAAPVAWVGHIADSTWKKSVTQLKGRVDLLFSMQRFRDILDKSKGVIQEGEDKLQSKIDDLTQYVDSVTRNGVAVLIAMPEIIRKAESISKIVDDLSKQADKISQEIKRMRSEVVQKIMGPMNN